jgi:hypothetical protein
MGKVSMDNSQGRQILLLVLIFSSLAMSGIGWYRISRLPRFSDDMSNFKVVTHQKFKNETVPLDGIEYIDCDFENVTFVFQGTTPVYLKNNRLTGSIWVQSGNGSVTSTAALLKGLGWLKPDVPLVGPEKNPIVGIEAPKP